MINADSILSMFTDRFTLLKYLKILDEDVQKLLEKAIESVTITKVENTDTYTMTFLFTDGTSETTNPFEIPAGADGVGIVSITKTATVGLVDTYTITYTDGTTSTFDVTNGANGTDGTDGTDGRGIVSITKTATVGLVDTYTITYTDGTTSTFDVTNGSSGGGGALYKHYVSANSDYSQSPPVIGFDSGRTYYFSSSPTPLTLSEFNSMTIDAKVKYLNSVINPMSGQGSALLMSFGKSISGDTVTYYYVAAATPSIIEQNGDLGASPLVELTETVEQV